MVKAGFSLANSLANRSNASAAIRPRSTKYTTSTSELRDECGHAVAGSAVDQCVADSDSFAESSRYQIAA